MRTLGENTLDELHEQLGESEILELIETAGLASTTGEAEHVLATMEPGEPGVKI